MRGFDDLGAETRSARLLAYSPFLETPMPVPLRLTVNGKAVQADIDPRTLLVTFIRETCS